MSTEPTEAQVLAAARAYAEDGMTPEEWDWVQTQHDVFQPYLDGMRLALRAAADVAEEPDWEYGEQSRLDPNTVWIVDPDSQSMIWADIPSEKRVRRRVAGPWMPVKQEGADDV